MGSTVSGFLWKKNIGTAEAGGIMVNHLAGLRLNGAALVISNHQQVKNAS
jgi:hypothetical protein